jgi:type IV secretion system protein VirB2
MTGCPQGDTGGDGRDAGTDGSRTTPGAAGAAALSFESLPGSLADPAGPSVLAAAVRWLEGTLLGTAATSVAVISVAAVGLMMLAGRIDLRRAMTVIAGCFILFGAAAIAAGIQAVAGLAGTAPAAAEPDFSPSPLAALPPPPPPQPARPANPDPLAGATVPNR